MFKKKDDRAALARLMELSHETPRKFGEGEADGQVSGENGAKTWRKFTVRGSIIGPFIVHASHIRGEDGVYRITHTRIGFSVGATSKDENMAKMLAAVLARLPGWDVATWAELTEEVKESAALMREMFLAQRWANLLMMVTE